MLASSSRSRAGNCLIASDTSISNGVSRTKASCAFWGVDIRNTMAWAKPTATLRRAIISTQLHDRRRCIDLLACLPGHAIFALCSAHSLSGLCEEATMTRGSKVFRPADVPETNASSYPEPFREGQRKRYNRRLSDHAGLKNYEVESRSGSAWWSVVCPSCAL